MSDKYLLTFALSLFVGSTLFAQLNEVKLTTSDGAERHRFGSAVALYGNVAAIAAGNKDLGNGAFGAVYLFENINGTWTETQMLEPDGSRPIVSFGSGLALWQNRLAIGAQADSVLFPNDGSVYLYEQSGNQWVPSDTLTAVDGKDGDRLGTSVAMWGSEIIAGAPLDDDMGTNNTGSAYIFSFNGNGWTQTEIFAPDPDDEDRFGETVAMSAQYAMVYSSGDDDVASASGAVYVFENTGSTWTYSQKLKASDAQQTAQFGISIDIDGDRAIIGADAHGGGNEGAAYVFQKTDTAGWVEVDKIVSSDLGASDFFGHAVAVQEDTLLISASGDSDNVTFGGALYRFVHNGTSWDETKIVPSDVAMSDFFGTAVALDSGYYFCTAQTSDELGFDSGKGYVFKEAGTAMAIAPELLLEDFQLFPNPARDAVQVSFQMQERHPLEIQLLNGQGQLVYVRKIRHPLGQHDMTIQTSDLPAGLYVLRIHSNQHSVAHKLLIGQ
ncbi:MAG: T9SS type A sorting domain-containing protein [Bacteroidota bacterium]